MKTGCNAYELGDYVYVGDWLYGQIVDLYEDSVRVEYDTGSGGGSMLVGYNDISLADPPKVYDHNPELNAIITELMDDWYRLVRKAKLYGMDIRFAPNASETLELYFHNDYPDLLLVDKSISCCVASKEDSND